MEFTLLELNEMIYCLGIAIKDGDLVYRELAQKIKDRLQDELTARCNEIDKLMEAETSSVERWG